MQHSDENAVKTILYVIDTLETGGTERSLLDFTQRLDRRRFRPLVCRLYEGDALQGEFESAGIPVRSCDLKGKYDFRRALSRLGHLVSQQQPDLIHTMLWRASQVGRTVGRWRRVPVVSSFVSVPYEPIRFEISPSLSRRKAAVVRFVDRLSARWVQRFHAVSNAARDSNCRFLKVDPSRVAVIPRGREIMSMQGRDLTTNGKLRDELRIRDSFPILLNVGRLIHLKGQSYLIDAMPEVLSRQPSAKLLVAGDGPLRDELQDQIERLQLNHDVLLLGTREDVPDLLALANVFVFPSLYEGLPGAVIEAMMAGRPIVASAIPQVMELIVNGQSGLLVQPKNAVALANAILRITENRDLAVAIGQRAKAVACENYDIRRVVRQMEEFYEQVLCDVRLKPT